VSLAETCYELAHGKRPCCEICDSVCDIIIVKGRPLCRVCRPLEHERGK
jgi:hypothetical protein